LDPEGYYRKWGQSVIEPFRVREGDHRAETGLVTYEQAAAQVEEYVGWKLPVIPDKIFEAPEWWFVPQGWTGCLGAHRR
jgi:hypothetical protein